MIFNIKVMEKKDKTLFIEEYLDKIRQYFSDIMKKT